VPGSQVEKWTDEGIGKNLTHLVTHVIVNANEHIQISEEEGRIIQSNKIELDKDGGLDNMQGRFFIREQLQKKHNPCLCLEGIYSLAQHHSRLLNSSKQMHLDCRQGI
jgi:hypothetical protein